MKKNNFPVITTLLLVMFSTISYSSKTKSISSETDSLSATYYKIPDNCILDKWLVLGPIPVFDGKPNQEDQTSQLKAFDTDYISPSTVYESIKAEEQVINNSTYKWLLVNSDDNGIINLTRTYKGAPFMFAYAFSQVYVAEDKEYLLGVGSDDGVKIWVNQKLVHSNWVGRGVIADNDLVPIKLTKGKNEILVKVQNMIMGWGFSCHLISPSEYTEKLFSSAKLGMIDNVNQLLKCGININAVSEIGLTPLQTARVYGQSNLVDYLIKNGADTTIQMPSKEKLVDKIFENILKNNYPGAAVLVSKDGKILCEKAYGYANLEDEISFKVDSKFRIASITKQFTAAAILKLQEQGALSVIDNVSKYLSDIPRGDEITIHQLLSHTSGLPRYWNDEFFEVVPVVFTPEYMAAEVKKLEYDFDPGEGWGYSNIGYYILSKIVEKASGLSFHDYLKKTFFVPLGMSNTGAYNWITNVKYEGIKNEVKGYAFENGKYYNVINLDTFDEGCGELYSTLEDLFKWNEALFNNRVLTETSLNAALTPVMVNGPGGKLVSSNYGYGFFLRQLPGIKIINHSGGLDGYESYLCRFQEMNFNMIIFVNRFPFPQGMDPMNVARDISQIYLWEEMYNNGFRQEAKR